MKLRLQDLSLAQTLPRLGVPCWQCRKSDHYALVVSAWPHVLHKAPQYLPLGDIIKQLGPAFKDHGEGAKGDATKIQVLLWPCSGGTCLAGGGDGDDWTELGQMPGKWSQHKTPAEQEISVEVSCVMLLVTSPEGKFSRSSTTQNTFW